MGKGGKGTEKEGRKGPTVLGRSGLKEKITGLVYPPARRAGRTDEDVSSSSPPASLSRSFKKWFRSSKSKFDDGE